MRPNLQVLKKLSSQGRLTKSQWGKQRDTLKHVHGTYGVSVSNGGYDVTDPEKLNTFIKELEEIEIQEQNELARKKTLADTPKAQNVLMYGSAHATPTKTNYFDCQVKQNDLALSLCLPNKKEFLTGKEVILIENPEIFSKGEHLFPKESVKLLYAGGHVPNIVLTSLINTASKVWIAPDYDQVGMQEYERTQQFIPDIELWLPNNIEELFKNYGKRLKGTEEPIFRRTHKLIWELSKKHNCCLEQEAMLAMTSPPKGGDS